MKKRFLPFGLLFACSIPFCLQAQWAAVTNNLFPANHRVWDIQMVNENVIWAFSSYDASTLPAAQLPIVHRSTDGGITWQSFPIPGMGGIGARDLSAVDSLVAYITLPPNGLFRTVNGGADWAPVDVSTDLTSPFLVHFYNENEGWVFGRKPNNHATSAWTTDAGATWTVVEEENTPPYFSGEFFASGYATNSAYDVVGDHIVIATNLGYYWKSSDRAQSWERIATPMSASGLWTTAIAMKDESTIMLVADGTSSTTLPTVAITTTDGGNTWTESAPGITPGAIHYIPCTNGTFILSGHNNFIPSNEFGTAITYDHGLTWEKIDDTRIISVDFLDAQMGVAALGTIVPWGSQGEVYKWTGNLLKVPRYVNDDATGLNNGTSWADAHTDLQAALAAAEEGDEIWVATGTYKPDTLGGSQNSTFLIDKNLKLYGGLAGMESCFSERGNPADHPTILSGDLIGNDIDSNLTANKLDNVLHVVKINANITGETVIDGFTIQHGYGSPY